MPLNPPYDYDLPVPHRRIPSAAIAPSGVEFHPDHEGSRNTSSIKLDPEQWDAVQIGVLHGRFGQLQVLVELWDKGGNSTRLRWLGVSDCEVQRFVGVT